MSFDVLGARKAGYTDDEIIQEMAKDQTFNVMAARQSGYSLEEISQEMARMPPGGAQVAPGQEISTAGVGDIGRAAETLENIPAGEILAQAGQMVSNIPRSGYEFGKSVYQAVRHPIETGKALGKTAIGAAELLVPGEQGYEQYAEGVGKFFADRYGGLENLRKTIVEDPVGFAADAASILTGVGAIVKYAGTAGKIGQVARAGEVMGKFGRAVEPIGAAVKAAKPIYRGARGAATRIAGKTSGIGQAAREQLLAGAPEAKAVMRGAMTGEEIVEEARAGLQGMRQTERAAYVRKLEKVKQATQGLDIQPVRNKLDEIMNSFGIEREQRLATEMFEVGLPTKLKFKKGGVQKAAIEDAREIIETIDKWGTDVGDLTPAGLDRLKQYLDDFYSPNKNTRAMVSQLRNEVKKILVDNVPEYKGMVGRYEKFKKLESEMERALSLNKRASADTALRKLTTGIKEDSGFRRQLMDELKDYTGKDIQAMIAGYVAQPKVSRAITTSIFGGAGLALPGIFGNPYLFALLPLASPRVVGELLVALGKTERAVAKVAAKDPPAGPRLGIFQAGRVGLMPEMEQ